MKRFFRIAALASLAALAALPIGAQTLTTVTATVVDPSGLPYSYAQVRITLSNSGTPYLTPCPQGGASCQLGQLPVTTTDVNGKFTVQLYANASISNSPGGSSSGSTYTFMVNEAGNPPPIGTGPQTFTATGVTISGASQNISSTLNALAPALANISGGTGCTVGGSIGDLQKNNGASGCNAAHINDGSTITGQLDFTEIENHVDDAIFNSGKPWYDVTGSAYGAVCDGTTNDTTAFTNAVAAQVAAGAIVYIPRSPNNTPCVVNLSAFSNSNGQEWVYVVDDNDLKITGGSITGNNVAIIGRSNQQEGLSGQWATQSHIDWFGSSTSVSPLQFNGLSHAYFEGIGWFTTPAATVPVANLHTNTSNGNGLVYISFKGDQFFQQEACSVEPSVYIGPDSGHLTAPAGFGMRFDGSEIDCVGNSTAAAMQIVNYGELSFGGVQSTFSAGGISVTENNVAQLGNFDFNNILSENLGQAAQTTDFLTLTLSNGGTIASVHLNYLEIADPNGTTYAWGGYSSSNGNVEGVSVTNSTDLGFGAYDPASTANIFGFSCLSFGCTGLAASAPLDGVFSFDETTGHGGRAYFGNANVSDPALELGAPNHQADLLHDQGEDFKGVSAPGNPSSGNGRLYFNSGSGQLVCITSSGANCLPTGSGSVSSVANSDSTLTVSPTTGNVVASLNLAHANTWSALQTLSAGLSASAITDTGLTASQAVCTDGSKNLTSSCSGIISSALSSLTNATTTNTLTNGNNQQVWEWALTTSNIKGILFGESSASTGGTSNAQSLVAVATNAGSTAIPLTLADSLSGSQILPDLYLDPIWNTTGVVDAAILLNVTNTASGTGSLLMDLQVGSSSQFKVDKLGNGTFNGGVITPSFTLNGGTAQTGIQGTDTKLMTAGTVSGTSTLLCTDANLGATTSGCPTPGSPGGSTNAVQYNAGGSTFGGTTVPSVNGFYVCGYSIAGGVGVAPSCPLAGITNRGVTGTTSTDTILYSDNVNRVDYQGSVAVAVTLPTATTLGNSHFATRLVNTTSGSATAVTVTPTTWTINGGATLTVAQGQECFVTVDASGTNWNSDCNDLQLVAGSNITITRGQYGPTIAASVTAGTALSSITNATGTNTLTNGNNQQTWEWALTGGSTIGLEYTESAAATGGSALSQSLVGILTGAGSTAVPLRIQNSLNGSQTLPALYVAPTWNTTGVVDAGILENVAYTAAGTGSLLMDLQVGSSSKFKVDNAGNGTFVGTVNGLTVPSAAGNATYTQTICSGTIALGTSAIASGAKSTAATATCTGAATTDNVIMDFNADPSAITGYAPSANGTLTLIKWVTANTVNVYQYNDTANSITPGSATVNFRVVR